MLAPLAQEIEKSTLAPDWGCVAADNFVNPPFAELFKKHSQVAAKDREKQPERQYRPRRPVSPPPVTMRKMTRRLGWQHASCQKKERENKDGKQRNGRDERRKGKRGGGRGREGREGGGRSLHRCAKLKLQSPATMAVSLAATAALCARIRGCRKKTCV